MYFSLFGHTLHHLHSLHIWYSLWALKEWDEPVPNCNADANKKVFNNTMVSASCRNFLEANFLLSPFVVAMNALVFFAWFYADFYSWLYFAGLNFKQVPCTRLNSTVIVKYDECTRIGNPEFTCAGFLHRVVFVNILKFFLYIVCFTWEYRVDSTNQIHYAYTVAVDFGWRGPVFEIHPFSSPTEAEALLHLSLENTTIHTCHIQHYRDVFSNRTNEFIILDLEMATMSTLDGVVYMAILFPIMIFNLICAIIYYSIKPTQVKFFNPQFSYQKVPQDVSSLKPEGSLQNSNQIEVELIDATSSLQSNPEDLIEQPPIQTTE